MNFLSIENYPEFEHVCDVSPSSTTKHWQYENVNENIMFSDHRSWVYFIVANYEIVKTGETGNPLGIKGKTKKCYMVTGTGSRIGRYMKNGGTDQFVRDNLQNILSSTKVSFYAKKCPIVEFDTVRAGQKVTTKLSSHKQEELDYLDLIVENTGQLPILNKARK
jgi:hypothetical protein